MLHSQTSTTQTSTTHADPAHHGWHLLSSHRTSEGVIRYEQCACGRIRVALDGDTIAASRRGDS